MKPLSLLCPSASGGWGDPLLRPGQPSSGTDLGVEANITCATALKSESCFLQISTNRPHCPWSFSNFKDESEKTKMGQKPHRTTALLLKWCFLLSFCPHGIGCGECPFSTLILPISLQMCSEFRVPVIRLS